MTTTQDIDRDALLSTLDELALAVHAHAETPLFAPPDLTDYTDRILALVRPVEGIFFSREDAALALPYIERAIESYPWEDDGPLRALASRLEANRA